LWVLLPSVAGNSDKTSFYVYSGNEKAAVDAAAGNATGLDAATRVAVHFQAQPAPGALTPATPPTLEPNGLLGQALKADGTAVVFAADERSSTAAGAALTVSLWAKPAADSGTLLRQGPLTLALAGGKLRAQLGSTVLEGSTLAVGSWAHVAFSVGAGKAVLSLNGAPVAQADVATPAIAGELRLAEGFTGQVDEVQLANTVRSSAWLALAAGTQGIGGKGLKSAMEAAGEGGDEQAGYMGILVKNLTVDAWVVIIILGVMMVVACWVMVSKALLVQRDDVANRAFLQQFRDARDNLLSLGQGGEHQRSSLFRLYAAGVRELAKRDIGTKPEAQLSNASLNAVRASVDADLVRESHRLNSQMVLLTIAISGGPFLGLLGTVVGVMITFAAIAAAGDVNVNAIAPGIAAALLATVAGLGVAIPALFGYNYLAARIKNISSDMQIFVDEFSTRVAEAYGKP
jgi:biopolymer transport protein ExbB